MENNYGKCKGGGGTEGNIDLFNKERIICDKKVGPFRPQMSIAWEMESIEFKIWEFMYKKFVCLNEDTLHYIRNEQHKNNIPEKKIGVLLRGTDYTTLKPKYHPIQPNLKEVLTKVVDTIKVSDIKNIYVTTEEEKYFEEVVEYFKNQNDIKVYKTDKAYYDKLYYQQEDRSVLGKVHLERKNENFKRGIEYLSSLVILSDCDEIIAGNCGGTLFALLYGDGYIHTYVFNKGRYV